MTINHPQTRRAATRKLRIGKIAARAFAPAALLLLGAAFDARAQATAPGAPTQHAPAVLSESLGLRWSAPGDTGSTAITGYKVRWAENAAPSVYLNENTADGIDAGGADAAAYAITGLTNGTTYQAQVAAVNGAGTGAWSAAQTAVPFSEKTSDENIQAVICLSDETVLGFNDCVEAARRGYQISKSASGAQTIRLSAHLASSTTPATNFVLEVTQDGGNPLVADVDTDGALPFAGATIAGRAGNVRVAQSFTITPKASGDGGRIHIAFNLTGGNALVRNTPADQRQGTFFQIVDADLQTTAANPDGGCPSANNADLDDLAVAEGASGNFCVSLSAAPSEDVTVACNTFDPRSSAGTKGLVTLSPAELVFTPANWNTAQALGVTAPDNDLASTGDTDTITCFATGDPLYSRLVENIGVTVSDTDTVSATGTLSAANISEDGGAQMAEITATLSGTIAPSANCTVTVTIGSAAISGTLGGAVAGSPGDYTGALSAPTITIRRGELSGSATLAITPVVDGDSAAESIPLSATAASCGGNAGVNFGDAEILILDTAIRISEADTGGACPSTHNADATAITLAEGGDAGALCVSLASAPASDVSIACASATAGLAVSAPAALTFTATNSNTAQAITVTAPNDDISSGASASDMFACTASGAADSGYNNVTKNIALTVTDADTVSATGTLSVSPVLVENNTVALTLNVLRVTATLDGDIAPASDCTLAVTVAGSPIAGTQGDALAESPGDYNSFNVPNFIIAAGALSGNTEGFITVTTTLDADSDIESIPLSATATCGGVSVAFTGEALIFDEGIRISQADADGTCPAVHNDDVSTVSLTEGATGMDMDSVCVSLISDPREGAPMTLDCSVDPLIAHLYSASPETLAEFARDNWNTGQAILISALDNDAANGTVSSTILCQRLPVGSGFYGRVDNRISITITDPDETLAATGTLAATRAISETGGAQMVSVTAALGGSVLSGDDCEVAVELGTSELANTQGGALASEGSDYTGAISPPAITIPALQASGSVTFAITPLADSDAVIESIPLSAKATCQTVDINFGETEILIADAAPVLAAPTPRKGQLALAWSAPAGAAAGTLAGYKVRWANAGSTADYLNTGGAEGLDVPGGKTATAYTITRLTNGVSYQVEVGATYSAGIAGVQWSAPQQTLAGAEPGAPRFLRSVISDGTLDLSWNVPQDEAITDHRVRWSAGAGGSDWVDPPGADGESTGSSVGTYQLTGLTNGTTYEVQVAAVNAFGNSDWASHQNNPATTPPNAPGDLDIANGVGLLRLSWTKPANDSGDAITEYAVRWAEGAGGSTWVDPPGADGRQTGSTVLSYTLTGLKSATTYEVQIAARNDAGTGAWSASVQGESGAFSADFDGDGDVEWQEAVIIARALAGMRGTALLAGMGASLESLDAEEVFASVQAGALSLDLDLDDSGTATIADGVMLVRYHLGVTEGEGLTKGMTASSNEQTVIENIEKLGQ